MMGEKPARKPRPTLMDVARKAGVSRATASLVVRKSPLVGAETRASVEAAMAEIGYVYNLGAAGMRAARSRTIGVIIPNLSNPFFGVLLAGIDQVVDGAGLATFIAHSAESAAKQDGFVTRMREHGVDGLIVCPAAGTGPNFVERLTDWGMPVVEALRTVGRGAVDYVGMDQSGGMDGAVARLVELSHSRIGFVTANLDHSAHDERLAAFRTATQRHGVKAAIEIEIDPTHGEAMALARRMAGTANAPTAWICHNDVIGLGMHRGFSDCGLMPGREVSLIGFDNVAETDLVRPGLASVATEPIEIGVLAAQLLLRRIETPEAAMEIRRVPSHFVERGSVGSRVE
ncbi:LacI family DNA-binding transcriptional regulator [Pelagibacterium sp.]|uniref:LacI family DNA-binding transcriptional regulator n=1 Tax=Pelagibacterium sp. TaxID=1967288 RepID=UPI003C7A8C87